MCYPFGVRFFVVLFCSTLLASCLFWETVRRRPGSSGATGDTGESGAGVTSDGCHDALPAPRVFFTDLTVARRDGGPNGDGAIVTIYGEDLGACRGSASVTIGGVEVAAYLAWAENVGARGLDRVVVQLAAGTPFGAQSLVMTTVSGSSEPVSLRVATSGRIRFASPNGSGDGSGPNAAMSFSQAMSQLAAGDVVYLRGGTYDTLIPQCGTAMGYGAVVCIAGGTANETQPIAVVGYLEASEPPARVAGPTGAGANVIVETEWSTIAGIELVPGSGTGVLTRAGQIRVVGVKGSGDFSEEVLGVANSVNDGVRILGNTLVSTTRYADSLDVRRAGAFDIGYNELGGSVLLRPEGTFTNVVFHHNVTGNGWVVVDDGPAQGIVIHDNVFRDGAMLRMLNNGAHSIRNNLFYLIDQALEVAVATSGGGPLVFTDNIVFAGGGGRIYATIDANANITGSHNAWNGGSDPVPAFDSAPVIGVVSFVDTASADFRPSAGSAVIDAATGRVGTDYFGLGTQGNGSDIGPFEFVP